MERNYFVIHCVEYKKVVNLFIKVMKCYQSFVNSFSTNWLNKKPFKIEGKCLKRTGEWMHLNHFPDRSKGRFQYQQRADYQLFGNLTDESESMAKKSCLKMLSPNYYALLIKHFFVLKPIIETKILASVVIPFGVGTS